MFVGARRSKVVYSFCDSSCGGSIATRNAMRPDCRRTVC
jgi:hypothetical protein